MFRSWIVLFAVFIAYTFFVYSNCDVRPTQDSIADAKALRGWSVWQERNCQSCHQIYGLGGYLGPDITNVISDRYKGQAYAAAIIKNGTAKMPNFKLCDSDVNNLVAFLSWINKSGKSKVPVEKVDWSGNYHL